MRKDFKNLDIYAALGQATDGAAWQKANAVTPEWETTEHSHEMPDLTKEGLA